MQFLLLKKTGGWLRGWDWRTYYGILLFYWVVLYPGVTSAAQLTLTWTDTSVSETGFRIERRADGEADYHPVATQGADTTFYVDWDVVVGKSYCYRVQAYNPVGVSEYSNEACATASSLMLEFEGPENGQAVSGISTIRGWAFDTVSAGKVQQVELIIDGSAVGDTPCCSPRGDVQGRFPQFPAENTANSGWGTGINWGELPPGSHSVKITVKSAAGETLSSETRAVTVVRPGSSSFVDLFSLNHASTQIDGQDLILKNVIVRDKATQQETGVTLTFRWFTNSQSFGMTQAFVVQNATAVPSSLFMRAAAKARWWWKAGLFNTRSAQAAGNVIALLESPEGGQSVFGVNVLRGWAFEEEPNATIRAIRLTVDEVQVPGIGIPCCSGRQDVAVAFPQNSNARNSGWGITLNYANLPAGPHTIGVQIESSAGAFLATSRQITVVKVGEFTYLDRIDLTQATAQIEGEDIVLSGVQLRDAASQQVVVVQLRLRWSLNSQSLGIIAVN